MGEPVDVLVIGAGPAGLGAAIGLRESGVANVVVVEREASAGGVPRHCAHPPFGMREFARIMTGQDYARRLAERAIAAGVDIRTRHSVTALLGNGVAALTSPAGAADIAARRIVLATGMRETTRAARLVSGERPQGILNTGAFQALVNLKGILPFRRPVIVGTELVGLSAISTCRKHGMSPAAIVEANAHASAPWPLRLYPRLLGIPVHFGAGIADVAGRSRVESVSLRLGDGTLRRIDCDGIIFTGQFVGEGTLAQFAGIATDTVGGGPVVDNFGRTSDPVTFAVGNLAHPAETAGWCFREGRRIARIVAEDLRGRTPRGAATTALVSRSGVKFTVPGRIVGSMDAGLDRLHVWTRPEARGTLHLTAGEEILWSKKILGQPSRRYDVPLGALKTGHEIPKIDIMIE
jgi:NADPH-dependent 2,4-dienoyl-CoA reductase/sulfur reductase-like enzyme